MRATSRLLVLGLIAGACRSTGSDAQVVLAPGWSELELVSSVDGTLQPSRVWLPPEVGDGVPVLLHLHTWSSDWRQESFVPELVEGCGARGWILAAPNFRGPNRRPEACASEQAVRDVLDLIDHLEQTFDVGPIFVHGASGGGHMGLILAGRHPERWAGVSSWVPISDLARWHRESSAASQKYWRDLEGSCGGPPGASAAIDAEYAARSPLTHLAAARGLAVDINTGLRDGHDGSVPVGHSLRAFNVLAVANGLPGEAFDEATIAVLEASPDLDSAPERSERRLRPVLLRRQAGPARVTLFAGGHEGDPRAALDWFDGLRDDQ
ncbi:MAG: prolyl oligopeptidase family serine peptidase [Planctomycetota bacterium]|nr:prolyl oligopeptidase family serine peptidase [Planctomycetota bacterium]